MFGIASPEAASTSSNPFAVSTSSPQPAFGAASEKSGQFGQSSQQQSPFGEASTASNVFGSTGFRVAPHQQNAFSASSGNTVDRPPQPNFGQPVFGQHASSSSTVPSISSNVFGAAEAPAFGKSGFGQPARYFVLDSGMLLILICALVLLEILPFPQFPRIQVHFLRLHLSKFLVLGL